MSMCVEMSYTSLSIIMCLELIKVPALKAAHYNIVVFQHFVLW